MERSLRFKLLRGGRSRSEAQVGRAVQQAVREHLLGAWHRVLGGLGRSRGQSRQRRGPCEAFLTVYVEELNI